MPLEAPVMTITCSDTGLSFRAMIFSILSRVRPLNERAGGAFDG
jgi:hypothetical protein